MKMEKGHFSTSKPLLCLAGVDFLFDVSSCALLANAP